MTKRYHHDRGSRSDRRRKRSDSPSVPGLNEPHDDSGRGENEGRSSGEINALST